MNTESTPGTSGRKTWPMQGTRPWRHIWLQPERTVRFAARFQPEHFLHRHFAALGVFFILAMRIPDWLYSPPHPIGVLVQVLLLGPVGGIVAGYVQAAAIKFTGSWIGGVCIKSESRIALAWTHVPFTLAYASFFFTYLLLYLVLIKEGQRAFLPTLSPLGYLPFLLFGIFFLWGLVNRIRGIAEIQGFGLGKALLNLLLTILFGAGPFLVMFYVYFTLALQTFRILGS